MADDDDVPAVVRGQDLAKVLDYNYSEEIKDAARKHGVSSVQRLVSLRDTAESESVQRGAAKDLIDLGRRVEKLNITNPEENDGRANITVNVVNFAGTIEGPPESAVAAALNAARVVEGKVVSDDEDL